MAYPFAPKKTHDQVERLLEDLGALHEGDIEVGKLKRRDSPPDSDFEPAAAQVVEHADFRGETDRIVKRKQVDERSEAQAARSLAERGQKYPRRGRHAEGSRVMFGEMVGVEPGGIRRLQHPKPSFVGLT
jgi:hypothetical protein